MEWIVCSHFLTVPNVSISHSRRCTNCHTICVLTLQPATRRSDSIRARRSVRWSRAAEVGGLREDPTTSPCCPVLRSTAWIRLARCLYSWRRQCAPGTVCKHRRHWFYCDTRSVHPVGTPGTPGRYTWLVHLVHPIGTPSTPSRYTRYTRLVPMVIEHNRHIALVFIRLHNLFTWQFKAGSPNMVPLWTRGNLVQQRQWLD